MKSNYSNHALMRPHLQLVENTETGTAVVIGSDFDAVQSFACNLVLRGYVPVEDEYMLMEHKRTGKQCHFRKVTLVQNNFYNE